MSEDNTAWHEWLATRPPNVRQVAEKLGPTPCFRSTENGGHYRLYSIDQHTDGTVTLKIIHGRDSYLPGVAVFGIDPDTMVQCGCGKWEPPTEEQVEATRQRVDAEKRRLNKRRMLKNRGH